MERETSDVINWTLQDSIKIYLDLDGVLANFLGLMRTVLDLPEDWHPNTRNFFDEINITPHNFYAKIEEYERMYGFWSKLPKHSWADELVDIVHHYDHVYSIATSPANDPLCYSGKRVWIDNHVSPRPHKIHMTNAKDELSKEGRLLIDDTEIECERWVDQGGYAILFPQQWNSNRGFKDPKDKIGYVRDKLRDYCG